MIELAWICAFSQFGNIRGFNETVGPPGRLNNSLKRNNPPPLTPFPIRKHLHLLTPSTPTWQLHGGRTAGTTAEFPQEQRSPTGLNSCTSNGELDWAQEQVFCCGSGIRFKFNRGSGLGRGTRVNEHEQTSSPSAPQTHWASICSN